MSLANLYSSQSRYAEAEPLYKRAIQGFERAQGPDGLDTLGTLNNLPLLYWKQGSNAEPEPLFKRAVAWR